MDDALHMQGVFEAYLGLGTDRASRSPNPSLREPCQVHLRRVVAFFVFLCMHEVHNNRDHFLEDRTTAMKIGSGSNLHFVAVQGTMGNGDYLVWS